MSNILKACELYKNYGARQTVKGISLSLESGKIIGLLGPNGAGKTTSFYMLVGLVLIANGKLFLDDLDITNMPVHLRAEQGIAYLPQEPSIFRKLTVEENILAILELRPQLTKAEREAKLEQLLEEFRLTHVRNSLGMVLSGGERRRTEIARCLAIQPKFLLLDEPFAGIDPLSILDVKRLINHLASKKIGILITDHNVRDTLTICEYAYIVNQGKIMAEGTPNDVAHNREVREVYLGEDFHLS